MSWITQNFNSFVTDITGGTIELFGNIINNVFFYVVKIALQNEYIKNAQKLLVAMALALIGLVVLKIVFSGYLLETDYDSEADPFNLVLRIAETTAVISCSGWIFDTLLQLSKDFANDMMMSTEVTGYSEQTQALLDPTVLSNSSNGITCYISLIAAMLIGVMVFMVVSGLRGGELIAMKLLLPIFALDMLTSSRERWNNFFMGYILAFFTYSFQILFYMVSIKSYASASYTNSLYLVTALIFLILAIRAPKFLEKYLYKSGVSSAASSGLRMIIQTAVIKAV